MGYINSLGAFSLNQPVSKDRVIHAFYLVSSFHQMTSLKDTVPPTASLRPCKTFRRIIARRENDAAVNRPIGSSK